MFDLCRVGGKSIVEEKGLNIWCFHVELMKRYNNNNSRVGNGAALLCTHMAKQTVLDVQGTTFKVDLHILPIHGPDIVLGMDWLESLGKVTADFAGKTLEFMQGGKPVVLRGILPPLCRISLHSLASWEPVFDTMEIYELLLLEPEAAPLLSAAAKEFPASLPLGVLRVLDKFRPVFNVPEGIPPNALSTTASICCPARNP